MKTICLTTYKYLQKAFSSQKHILISGTESGQWSTDNCFGLQAFVCKVPVGK